MRYENNCMCGCEHIHAIKQNICVCTYLLIWYEHVSAYVTRHEHFHGKFSLCAEYLIRSIGQEVLNRLKVFLDYSEMFIWKKIQTKECIAFHIKLKSEKVGQ